MLYRKGSSGGAVGSLYGRLRKNNDYNRPSRQLALLGRKLRQRFLNDPVPVVVAHPILVAVLKGKPGLLYQHGEMVTPHEAVVRGADRVIVPTEQAAGPFLKAGYAPEQIMISGLCVEPALGEQAEAAYRARRHRIAGRDAMVGFFVSSGSEPEQHVAAIIESVASCVRGEGKALVLAREGGRLERRMMAAVGNMTDSFAVVRDSREMPDDLSSVILAVYSSRRQENELTARLFAHVDYLVAPPHERTNWSMGLGLPMFALVPVIGPFAPLNLSLLLRGGTAVELTEPSGLDANLRRLRDSGRLLRMAEAGWGRYDIDGFLRIARHLVAWYGKQSRP